MKKQAILPRNWKTMKLKHIFDLKREKSRSAKALKKICLCEGLKNGK